MKFKCSGYTPQSNICNCGVSGVSIKCPIAVIEADEALRCEVRCPRKPWLERRRGMMNMANYVKHVEVID